MKLLGLAIVLMSAGAGPLNAQTTTATILGTVTDPTGAFVPGASVEARNVESASSAAISIFHPHTSKPSSAA